jgi:alpha-tubulin suppressor-like RCC1 family protein
MLSGATVAFARLHVCALSPANVMTCKARLTTGEAGCPLKDFGICNRRVAGVDGASAMSVGEDFSCALVDGTVRCLGRNDSGQLGHAPHTLGDASGTFSPNPTPQKVEGVDGATVLATGTWSTCVIVAGAVRCWGSNSNAKLGHATETLDDTPNGIFSFNPTPRDVPGVSDAALVVVGSNGACATTNAGALHCWGGPSSLAPYRVPSPTRD